MNKYAYLMLAAAASVTSVAGIMLKGQVPKGVAVTMFLVGMLVALLALVGFVVTHNQGVTTDTQRTVSDKDFLRLFEQQPGGLLSVRVLAEKTGLSVSEARTRAMALVHAGVLRAGTNQSAMRHFFELTAPLEEVPGLELSPEPFLTVGDLQKIFRAYDYKVSPQDLIMATGLPWVMIARELQHFRKKGVVEGVRIARPNDSPVQYILLEPYLSVPPEGEQARGLDLEMQKILMQEELIV